MRLIPRSITSLFDTLAFYWCLARINRQSWVGAHETVAGRSLRRVAPEHCGWTSRPIKNLKWEFAIVCYQSSKPDTNEHAAVREEMVLNNPICNTRARACFDMTQPHTRGGLLLGSSLVGESPRDHLSSALATVLNPLARVMGASRHVDVLSCDRGFAEIDTVKWSVGLLRLGPSTQDRARVSPDMCTSHFMAPYIWVRRDALANGQHELGMQHLKPSKSLTNAFIDMRLLYTLTERKICLGENILSVLFSRLTRG